jgi:hypothetical protein
VLFVDNGGFFPEEGDTHRDVAWFLMDAMKTLNIDAVNVGQRDLRYGLQFLVQRAKYDHLPMVSANLLDKKSRKPIFQPYLIKKVGNVKVGVLGLMSDKGDFGPGKDSLVVDDPLAVRAQERHRDAAQGAHRSSCCCRSSARSRARTSCRRSTASTPVMVGTQLARAARRAAWSRAPWRAMAAIRASTLAARRSRSTRSST